MEGKRKYCGGADKNRKKQRKLLMKEAGKCKNISDMFYHKFSSSIVSILFCGKLIFNIIN
jgi:hypothetical protein